MPAENFDELVRRVLDASESDVWGIAVGEWAVSQLEEDPLGCGVCVCGHTGLVKLFTITNQRNRALLYPIGSVCVNQFGREELDQQVKVYDELLRLRKAILDGSRIRLTSDLFSRALLVWLFNEGSFPPDEYNNFDGERDLEFLLKMFNKRNKDALTRPQQKKITAILLAKVMPFVRNYENLK